MCEIWSINSETIFDMRSNYDMWCLLFLWKKHEIKFTSTKTPYVDLKNKSPLPVSLIALHVSFISFMSVFHFFFFFKCPGCWDVRFPTIVIWFVCNQCWIFKKMISWCYPLVQAIPACVMFRKWHGLSQALCVMLGRQN